MDKRDRAGSRERYVGFVASEERPAADTNDCAAHCQHRFSMLVVPSFDAGHEQGCGSLAARGIVENGTLTNCSPSSRSLLPCWEHRSEMVLEASLACKKMFLETTVGGEVSRKARSLSKGFGQDHHPLRSRTDQWPIHPGKPGSSVQPCQQHEQRAR